MIERSPHLLDSRLHATIVRDLTVIAAARTVPTGLSTPIDANDPSIAGRIMAVVEDFRWRGMRVDLSGVETVADGYMPSEAQVGALILALSAALENVNRHARPQRADLSIGRTAENITVMVVDAGGGFDPDTVPHDRLRLRESIVARLHAAGGTARVWSGPGGTTVLMSVPVVGPVNVRWS